MQLPYMPEDPHELALMDHLRQKVVESTGSNIRIDFGKVKLSCTTNTLATQNVRFKQQYLKGTTPIVLVSLSSPSALGATVTPSTASETYQGFVAQALSSATQTVTVVWAAIGQTG